MVLSFVPAVHSPYALPNLPQGLMHDHSLLSSACGNRCMRPQGASTSIIMHIIMHISASAYEVCRPRIRLHATTPFY